MERQWGMVRGGGAVARSRRRQWGGRAIAMHKAMSHVKCVFTPSVLFQSLGPVVTSKLLRVRNIQQ
jgi:hypothetical protein